MNTFLIEFIEVKKDLLFIAGTALSELSLGDTFSTLYQLGKRQSDKKKLADVSLKIQSILLNGEAIETTSTHSAPMLILEGNFEGLLEAAQALNWRKKGERFFRSSEEALSFESSET